MPTAAGFAPGLQYHREHMKLISYRFRNLARVGAIMEGRAVDLTSALQSVAAAPRTEASGESPGDMLALLRAGPDVLAAAIAAVEGLIRRDGTQMHPPLADVELLAPVPRPGKIVAVGRNYADHAAETGMKALEAPRIISKLPSSVTAPRSVVVRPEGIVKLDYEVELGVVIGRPTKHVRLDGALSAVAGYTILNDVSAREFQFYVSPPQTTFAKSMDGFCPMGPWIVTRDEIPDPQDLRLQTWVNDELLQDGSTHDMIFPVAVLIEYISRFMTLAPGDVIATGTPAGVGAFHKPPRWLKPGDRVKLAIAKIGLLEHTIG
jgi:2-keto-4-pentenoate hydratase/2-oxohepta-3-ene-1,7-dioic acid hydratase in catechol pathway